MLLDLFSKYRTTFSTTNPWGPDSTDVTIIPPASPIGHAGWVCAHVHRLSGEENGGENAVFVDLMDEYGTKFTAPLRRAVTLGNSWYGQSSAETSAPIPFDKTDGGPIANVVIFGHEQKRVWVIDEQYPSEIVANLRVDIMDNSPGRYYGHQSYYVVFQLRTNPIPVPPTFPPITTLYSLEQRVTVLEKLLNVKA